VYKEIAMEINHNNNNRFLEKDKIREVVIWDETLRDGEQAPGAAFSLQQKIQLAELLDEAGVGIIDLGFPVVSEEERQTVKTINRLGLNARTGVTLRAKKEDIDCALNCGIYRGFIFAPTSQLLIHTRFNMEGNTFKEQVLEVVKYALEMGMEVFFISEDTSRSDLEYIIPYFNELYQCGVDKIMITDTVGIMIPTTMKKLTAYIIENCHPGIKFGIHCHNDFGLATANTLAAIEAGITFPTLTLNGIGERAGNASFEETIMALELIYKVDTGIDLKKIMPLSRMVEQFSGLPVAPNKAVVGFNAFRHESGIHIHAMLKALETYETFPPEILGRKREFVLGKHSGRSLIRSILPPQSIGTEIEDILIDEIKRSDKNGEAKEKMIHQLQQYYMKELGITEDELLNLYHNINARLRPIESSTNIKSGEGTISTGPNRDQRG